MTSGVERQVAKARQHIINLHLDLLLLLLASHEVSIEHQRARVDRLVQSLHNITLQTALQSEGRPIPYMLNMKAMIPQLTLNASLLHKTSLEEMIAFLAKPIAQMLALSPLEVGLVFQGADEQKLRNLYHGAQPKVRAAALKAGAVRAVIERRLERFMIHLRDLVGFITQGKSLQFSSPIAFINNLEARSGAWPEWIDVAHDAFASQTQAAVEAALQGVASMPSAQTVIELCWDSIGLSSRSLLKSTARRLRAQSVELDHEFLLRSMAKAVAPDELGTLEWLNHWPALGELQSAWEELHSVEYAALGHFHHGSRVTPPLSVLVPPHKSMGLCLPESLPWDYPLLCWSERETDALRDLLSGFAKTTQHAKNNHVTEETEVELVLVEDQSSSLSLPLDVETATKHINMRFVARDLPQPLHYDEMIKRAKSAVLERLLQQFGALEEKMQRSVLHRLRGSYDGFFPGTGKVWERRFQGWEQEPLKQAFVRLSTPVSELLNCPAFFDPFESPRSSQILPMPRFCFVIALSSHFEKIAFQVPIATLVLTGATGTPALAIRLVEVPNDTTTACSWVCDNMLNMDETHRHPVQDVLGSVKGNMLRMIVHQ